MKVEFFSSDILFCFPLAILHMYDVYIFWQPPYEKEICSEYSCILNKYACLADNRKSNLGFWKYYTLVSKIPPLSNIFLHVVFPSQKIVDQAMLPSENREMKV